jgi:hypothetical protein
MTSVETEPTANVHALSPTQPPKVAPVSTLRMSPSSRTVFCEGKPWTICSLTDAQMLPGKPPYPLKVGMAPWSLMKRSTAVSISLVVTPGFAIEPASLSAAFDSDPADFICSICSGLLMRIIAPAAP